MPALLIVGSVSRDRLWHAGRRITPPGGAPWHAAIALRRDHNSAAITVVTRRSAWVRALAAPGLAALGVTVAGRAGGTDTRFDLWDGPWGRDLRLREAAPAIGVADLPSGRWAAAVCSPLHPADVAVAVLSAVRARAAFTLVDVQGLLRRVGPDGRVRWEPPAAPLPTASALKFSTREFAVAFPGRDWQSHLGEAAATLESEVLISAGADGAAVSDGRTLTVVPAPAPAIPAGTESTGVGDVLAAVYALARGGGADPPAALRAAVAVANRLLQRRAAATPVAARIARALRSLEAAARWQARRSGPEWGSALLRLDDRAPRALADAWGLASAPGPSGEEETMGRFLGLAWAAWSSGWPLATVPPALLESLADAAWRRLPPP